MAGNAEQLCQHDADHLGSGWHLDTCHFFHGHDVREVVHHAAQVINPVGIGYERMPGLPFAHLFGGSVVIADIRYRVDHDLAVELQRDPEHPVNTGMVRPEIEEHEVRVLGLPVHAPFFGDEPEVFLLSLLKFRRHLERIHLRGPRRMFLAQWVAFPQRRRENSPQVRMIIEDDAKHVERFAFVPVRALPDGGKTRQSIVGVTERDFDSNILVSLERHQVIKSREVSVGLSRAMFAQAFIYGGEIQQQRIRPCDLIFQKTHDRQQTIFRNPERGYAVYGGLKKTVSAELRLELHCHACVCGRLIGQFRHFLSTSPGGPIW